MSINLEPKTKKGLVLSVLLVLLVVCALMAGKYRGPCAGRMALVAGFALYVLTLDVLIGKEAIAWRKYLYIAQHIVWVGLIIVLYLNARYVCGG